MTDRRGYHEQNRRNFARSYFVMAFLLLIIAAVLLVSGVITSSFGVPPVTVPISNSSLHWGPAAKPPGPRGAAKGLQMKFAALLRRNAGELRSPAPPRRSVSAELFCKTKIMHPPLFIFHLHESIQFRTE